MKKRDILRGVLVGTGDAIAAALWLVAFRPGIEQPPTNAQRPPVRASHWDEVCQRTARRAAELNAKKGGTR